MSNTINLVNPPADVPGRNVHQYRERKWLFSFACGTQCLVWARGVEEALEEAAAWLVDNAPGVFVEPEYEYVANESDLPWPPPPEHLDPAHDCMYVDVVEQAEVDLTYTESGWIPSYEWCVYEIDRADIVAMKANGAEFLIA